MKKIAIYGGTFDPIHYGHLLTAKALQDFFKFDALYFLPCKDPLIKPGCIACTNQRIDMLKLALEDYPEFSLNLCEIERETPSYMVKTLESFHEENEALAITLILGKDAFANLPQWYCWEKLLSLSNLLVIARPDLANTALSESLHLLLSKHQILDPKALFTAASGHILLFDAGNYALSSTDIRQKIKKNISVANELPPKVYEYIKKASIY